MSSKSSNEPPPPNQATENPGQSTSPVMSGLRTNFVAACIISTQMVQIIPYGAGVNSALYIGQSMGAGPVESTWIAASYPLTQGAFLLAGGRLGAIYGHKNLVTIAGVIWVIFNLVSGFVREFKAHCAMRALAGIGGAFMVPNALAMLTILLPPGRKRNVSIGFFGAMAPIGAAGGTVLPGLLIQLTGGEWKWLYYFYAIFGAIIFVLFALIVPQDPEPIDKDGTVDYVGASIGISALVIFNFVWNQAPIVGWDTTYVYVLLIVSVLAFGAFVLWEMKFVSQPILPLSIFRAPTFTPMLIAAFLTFMSVGISIWYVTVINIEIRHYTLLGNAASYATLALCGALAAVISGLLVPIVPAQMIMITGSIASVAALILVATSPAHQTYWAQFFPALILTAFGPDFLFTASQIVASNSVPRSQQGIAGSLIGSLLSYGLSTGLGFAGTVDAYTSNHGRDKLAGHRNALWLGVGMASTAAIIAMIFVRIPKDTREGWDKEELETREIDQGNS